jgi:hypothetical protein
MEREAAQQQQQQQQQQTQQQQDWGYDAQRGPPQPLNYHGQPMKPLSGHPHPPPQPTDPRHRGVLPPGVGVGPAPPPTVVYQFPPGLAPPPGLAGAPPGHGLLDPRGRPGGAGLNPLLGGPPGVNLVVTVQAAPSYNVGLPPGLMVPGLAPAPTGEGVVQQGLQVHV